MAQPTISDIIEIEQLLARYAVGITQDDVESVMDGVFTPDGTYSAFGSTYQLHDFPRLVAGGRDAGRPHDPTRPEPTETEAR